MTENKKEENGLVKIDKAIERVITIKIYIFMIIGMMLYAIFTKNHTMTFLAVIMFYFTIKLKAKYKDVLVDDKEYEQYMKLKAKYEKEGSK